MKKFWVDLKKYMHFAVYTAKTDLKAEVANSYLNWIWWVLQPMMDMVVYAFVFQNVFGNNIQAFPAFIYSGLVMWSFFSRSISYSVQLVRSNREIVTRVYVPKFVLLLGNMFGNLFKMFIGFLVLVPLLFFYHIPINIYMLQLIPVLIVFFIFTFGCGTIFLHFGVFVDDLSYAVSILLNMLMIMSGIFYDIHAGLTKELGVILGRFNPIAIFIDEMRQGLMYETIIDSSQLFVWLLISVLLCVLGIRLIYKNENSYVKVI